MIDLFRMITISELLKKIATKNLGVPATSQNTRGDRSVAERRLQGSDLGNWLK